MIYSLNSWKCNSHGDYFNKTTSFILLSNFTFSPLNKYTTINIKLSCCNYYIKQYSNKTYLCSFTLQSQGQCLQNNSYLSLIVFVYQRPFVSCAVLQFNVCFNYDLQFKYLMVETENNVILLLIHRLITKNVTSKID